MSIQTADATRRYLVVVSWWSHLGGLCMTHRDVTFRAPHYARMCEALRIALFRIEARPLDSTFIAAAPQMTRHRSHAQQQHRDAAERPRVGGRHAEQQARHHPRQPVDRWCNASCDTRSAHPRPPEARPTRHPGNRGSVQGRSRIRRRLPSHLSYSRAGVAADMVSKRLRLPSACILFVAIWMAFVRHAFGAQATTLNLSQDLVALGIAGSNMVPNQPALDAGPLFMAGVAYAKSHGITTVATDPGTYYFLSTVDNTHVMVVGIDNMTIDFHGASLIFTHPLYYGLVVHSSTNATVQNLTADFQPLPFTQLRVVAVDVPNSQIQYTVEPGYQHPSAFNSLTGWQGVGPRQYRSPRVQERSTGVRHPTDADRAAVHRRSLVAHEFHGAGDRRRHPAGRHRRRAPCGPLAVMP